MSHNYNQLLHGEIRPEIRFRLKKKDMAIRVTCINKSGGFHLDPHHSLTNLGWIEDVTEKRGKSSRQEVYNWLKHENGQAYVVDRQGHKASVLPRENAHGTQFLQTVSDRVWTDNLLALPECES